MKVRLSLFVFICYGFLLSAQENGLPHFRTIEENMVRDEYFQNRPLSDPRSITTTPPGPVRTMAEWEQIQVLIITWAGHTSILREIVRNAVKECKVLILTTNPGGVSTQLTDAGISMDSVRFVVANYNSIWVRDYGPWTVYQNDVDSLFLIDWIYNRPRPKDDISPRAIGSYLDIPLYEAIEEPFDWVHTGGNHLPDGMGTAFSSRLVVEENPNKTEAELDSIANHFLGVSQYIKFPTLPYDGIHHLDMHMRILDEETILFGEYPEGVADGPQINANIQYLLDNFKTSFGNDYKIIRVPMPPDAGDDFPDKGGDYRTYTNSIFINKTILVPIYEERYDTTALRIYRENLPGYNVVGINCNSIIPSLGALHCITKSVGVDQPLLIAHARLRDSGDETNDYPVSAMIKHVSGISSASVHYRLKGDSTYTILPMIMSDTLQHRWTTHIPAQPAQSEVQYFIQAQASNGKMQVRPIVAPEGYFRFFIEGVIINQPPQVHVAYPSDGEVFNRDDGGIEILLDAIDPDGTVSDVVVYINGDSTISLNEFPYSFYWPFPSEGEFELSARVTDDQGSVTDSEPVVITIQDLTSTKPLDEISFHLYPNPVDELLNIECDGHEIRYAIIFNTYGQRLSLNPINSGDVVSYDFSGFPSGIYFVKLEGVDEVMRVIKI